MQALVVRMPAMKNICTRDLTLNMRTIRQAARLIHIRESRPMVHGMVKSPRVTVLYTGARYLPMSTFHIVSTEPPFSAFRESWEKLSCIKP